MRYFGVSKRVKVSDKVEPRDFDRSKVFEEVTPVVDKKIYLVVFYKDLCMESLIKREYMKDTVLLYNTIVNTLNIHSTLSCNEECLNELRKEIYYITHREIK